MSEVLKSPVVIRLYKSEQLLGIRQFTDTQIVFGRQSELQLHLDDPKVSIIHAAIEERDSGYYICDLGSETGTKLNGETVLDTKLESGDLIQIGDYKIEFYIGVPKPKGAPPKTDMGVTSLRAENKPVQPPAEVLAPEATLPANQPPSFSAPPSAPPQVNEQVNEQVNQQVNKQVIEQAAQSGAAPVPEVAATTINQASQIQDPAPVNTPVDAPLVQAPHSSTAPISPTDESMVFQLNIVTPPVEKMPEPKASVSPEPEPVAPTQSPIAQPTPSATAVFPSVLKIETNAAQNPVSNTQPTRAAEPTTSAPAQVSANPPGNTTNGANTTLRRPAAPRPNFNSGTQAVNDGLVTTVGDVTGRANLYRARVENKKKKKKGQKTFAPPSKYERVSDYVKPSKGTIVEVIVAWRERVIATYHYGQRGVVTVGSHPTCDIVLPILNSKSRKIPLLKIDARAVILISNEMTGEMMKGNQTINFAELTRQNRLIKQGTSSSLLLDQGEMVKLDVGESVSILIRYVSDAPKPLVAPFLDLSAAEAVGIIMALVMVAVLGLYTYLYMPPQPLADEKNDEPQRNALIVVKPPPPPPVPKIPVVESTPAPIPTPAPVVKSTPSPTKAPVNQHKAQELTAKKDPGKASEVAPNKNKTGPKQLTSVKQGGSVKTTDKPAAQAQSQKKDVTKQGVFSVFGPGGRQKDLSQEYSGVGELAGVANSATGKAGMNENRAGEGLGSALKDTGRGGKGTSQIGVPGVKTSGRGSGDSGYGSHGLGNHKGVSIVPGGAEESFSGTIDREAIRRVIQANLRAIRACYERELNRKPDLFGKVVIEWDIGDHGRVIRAHVKSSELEDALVGQCVTERLKTWTFPEPPANNEVTVSYPFFFSN